MWVIVRTSDLGQDAQVWGSFTSKEEAENVLRNHDDIVLAEEESGDASYSVVEAQDSVFFPSDESLLASTEDLDDPEWDELEGVEDEGADTSIDNSLAGLEDLSIDDLMEDPNAVVEQLMGNDMFRNMAQAFGADLSAFENNASNEDVDDDSDDEIDAEFDDDDDDIPSDFYEDTDAEETASDEELRGRIKEKYLLTDEELKDLIADISQLEK